MGMNIPISFGGSDIGDRLASQVVPPSGGYGKPNVVLYRAASYSTLSAGYTIFAGLFFVDRPISVTDIHGGFQAGVATSTLRVGIYTVDPVLWKPAALVIDGGAPISGASAVPFTITLGSPVILPPGFYCDALLAKTANPTLRFKYGLDLPLTQGSGSDQMGAYRWISNAGGADNASAFPATPVANTMSYTTDGSWYNYLYLKYTNV